MEDIMAEEKPVNISEENATEEKNEFGKLIESLKQERDELILQLHLGKAEAKEELEALEKKWQQLKAEADALGEKAANSLQAEWDELEKKWEKFTVKTKPLQDETKDVVEDVGAAVELVAEEIKRGYDRLRKLF
jgi:DNA repair exonuclease SbcCD ATPase subunit